MAEFKIPIKIEEAVKSKSKFSKLEVLLEFIVVNLQDHH